MKALGLAVLMACGGTAPTPAPPGNRSETETPAPSAPPYAGLFVEKTWTFPAVATAFPSDADAEPTVDPGHVTCTVSEVKTIEAARWMTLVCEHDTTIDVFELPAGHFAAQPDGLWEVGEDYGVTQTAMATLLMPATPVAGEVKQPARAPTEKDPDAPADEDSHTVTLSLVDGAWCIQSSASLGREYGSWTLCLKNGAIVGGRAEHGGMGESQNVEFGTSIQ